MKRITRGLRAFGRAIGVALRSIDPHDVMLYGGIVAVGYGAAMTYGDGVGLMVGGGISLAWAFLPGLRTLRVKE